MSLEENIARLNVNIEALTGAIIALAAHMSSAGSGAAAAPAAPTKDKPKGKGTRPNPATVAADEVDPFAEKPTGGAADETDPFASEGGGDDEPTITLQVVKDKFLALRDLAQKKYGEDEGRAKVREMMNKFAGKLDDIKPEQFEDAIAACDKAEAALVKMKDKK